MKTLARFVVALCAVPFAACSSVPSDLTARSLTIVDDHGEGRVRIRMRSESESRGPVIEMLDRDGTAVFTLRLVEPTSVGSDEPDGQPTLELSAKVADGGHEISWLVAGDGSALSIHRGYDQWVSVKSSGNSTGVLLCVPGPESAGGEGRLATMVNLVLEPGRLVLTSPRGELGAVAVPSTPAPAQSSVLGESPR